MENNEGKITHDVRVIFKGDSMYTDREETIDRFADAVINGINKPRYELKATPVKVIQIEELKERLDKLERYAHITCWRCLKEIPFSEAKIIVWPGDEGEIVLCSDCKLDYDLTENKEHYRYECALKDYLKEIRRQKK